MFYSKNEDSLISLLMYNFSDPSVTDMDIDDMVPFQVPTVHNPDSQKSLHQILHSVLVMLEEDIGSDEDMDIIFQAGTGSSESRNGTARGSVNTRRPPRASDGEGEDTDSFDDLMNGFFRSQRQ
jgi:hypothetical protein